jgi:squalene-hopene/tetraprenyl-beta-curcumene cyclase
VKSFAAPVVLVLACSCLASSAHAADEAAIRAAVAKAAAFLEKRQAADGSLSAEVGPAVTALAVTALVKSGTPVDAPVVQKAIARLLSFKRADGGIYVPESPVSNYETALAMVALAACNQGGTYDKEIKGCEAYVKGLQWDEGEGKSPADPAYGGAGYGKKGRPDLSNTQFMIEALRSIGVSENDPAIEKALVFVSRAQNLEGPANTTPFPANNTSEDDKGGFYYTPAAGGESQAGGSPEGGLRSYGSMTYAGLKSMIFAGLTKDDYRVKAALKWLGRHYTFKENPGMGQAGIYYYFHTAAKSLDVLGVETFTDTSGKEHAWRAENSDEILARQKPDGSWVNENAKWMEDNPDLVTSYALLALAYCLPPAGR